MAPYAATFATGLVREIAQRALKWKKLFDPVLPGIYIGWVQSNDIAFPEELRQEIIKRGDHILDWKSLYDELLEKNNKNVDIANEMVAERDKKIEELESKLQERGSTKKAGSELGAREKETLLRMIIGMAIDGYGYDPKANKSPTTKEIEGALDRIGLRVSDDTIRKRLREAAELLPSGDAE